MKVLYHASQNKDLSVLEPQRTISKDKYIGDYIFATEDKILALMYLVPKGYGIIMHSGESPSRIQICADEAEIRAKDKGGAIYHLDASDFQESPQAELSGYERVSKQPLRPIFKDVYKSSFDALEKFGVIIEFIDQVTFEHLIKL